MLILSYTVIEFFPYFILVLRIIFSIITIIVIIYDWGNPWGVRCKDWVLLIPPSLPLLL